MKCEQRKDSERLKDSANSPLRRDWIMFGLIHAVSIRIQALSSPKPSIPCSNIIRKPTAAMSTFVMLFWASMMKILTQETWQVWTGTLKTLVGSHEDGLFKNSLRHLGFHSTIKVGDI